MPRAASASCKWIIVATTSLLLPLLTALASGQTTSRLSVDSQGNPGNADSFVAAMTPDGRYVAFHGIASNLVAKDTNASQDVFVHDRETGTTVRVSVSSSGVQGNSMSMEPAISDDGDVVAFLSHASNLVDGDTNRVIDAFVHVLSTGITTRVSVSSEGAQADRRSYLPTVSGNGRYVAFCSAATNLVAGDTNDLPDVFLYDLVTGKTKRISVGPNGEQGKGTSAFCRLSADGRIAVFGSGAWNFVAGDTNGVYDVFLRDLETGSIERLSVDSAGNQGNDQSDSGVLSADGSVVAFASSATNLDPADTNDFQDVYLRDLAKGTTELLSIDSNGTPGDWHSGGPYLSADGRFVAFSSAAKNWFPDDPYPVRYNSFLRDRIAGTLTRVSGAWLPGDGTSYTAGISGDARFVAFGGDATNLVAGDTNGADDVFVRDMTIPADDAWWASYGDGFAGTLGIPTMVPTADPVLGSMVSVQLSNSPGVPTLAIVLLGGTPVSQPTNARGTLLVAPAVIHALDVPVEGATLDGTLPDDPALIGIVIVLQALELDAGAERGLSFTDGLSLCMGR